MFRELHNLNEMHRTPVSIVHNWAPRQRKHYLDDEPTLRIMQC